ncbi:ATP-grasp domain-containing protein [Salimicrobium jeotgali]|uniref:ATP-grasp domain-containing protein n=1 Tax=Salimicrobium jeotgali TaxID=1230341 RepID=UPI000C828375|nr:ATP-grasp domain-containing protein [Salimicrobium jeotgali]
MNILILSCGTRNKIVQYFKQELNGKGKVIATDCSRLAPALYEADSHHVVPKIDEPGYLDNILSICKENNIHAVLSLIDPELNLLAKYRERFLEIGTMPIVSETRIVEFCFNKYKFHEFLKGSGFNYIKSYLEKELLYEDIENGRVDYPVFVKPVDGSASLNISKVHSEEELEFLFSKYNNLMVQEFMKGTEYGVDVYVDLLSNEPTTIFIKEKLKMRAGETDKAVSVKNEEIYKLVQDFFEKTEAIGVFDLDIFEVNNEYYISEVNPRFGGGYPHAHESGANIPRMIVNNINRNINENTVGNYKEGLYMMKFNDLIVSF